MSFKFLAPELMDELYESMAALVASELNNYIDSNEGIIDSTLADTPEARAEIDGYMRRNIVRLLNSQKEDHLSNAIVHTLSSLPYSSNQLNKKLIASIASDISKSSVLTKFDGIMSVVTSGYNSFQLTEVIGGYLQEMIDGNYVRVNLPKDRSTILNGSQYYQWKQIQESIHKQLEGLKNAEETDEIKERKRRLIDYKGFVSGKTRNLKSPELKIRLTDSNGAVKTINGSKYDNADLVDFPEAIAIRFLATGLRSGKSLDDIYNNIVKNDRASFVLNELMNEYYVKIKEGENSLKALRDKIYLVSGYNIQPDESTNETEQSASFKERKNKVMNDLLTNVFSNHMELRIVDMDKGILIPSIKQFWPGVVGLSVDVTPGECAMPFTMKNKFLIRLGDNLSTLLNRPGLFVKRINDRNNPYSDSTALKFDNVFINDSGGRIYISKTGERLQPLRFDIVEINGSYFMVDGKQRKKFRVYADEGDTLDTVRNRWGMFEGQLVFKSDNEAVIGSQLKLINDSTFNQSLDTSYEYHPNLKVNEEFNRERLKRKYRILGTGMYNSFKAAMDVVASRTPGQSLQSFQQLRITSFFEGEENVVIVPTAVMLYSGSDHDGDKVNVIMRSVTKRGVLAKWHIAFTVMDVDSSLKLPMPENRSLEQLESLYFTETDPEDLSQKDDLINADKDKLLKLDVKEVVALYEQLSRGKKTDDRDILNLLHVMDTQKNVTYKRPDGREIKFDLSTAGIKGFAVDRLIKLSSSPSNFVISSKPMLMSETAYMAKMNRKADLIRTYGDRLIELQKEADERGIPVDEYLSSAAWNDPLTPVIQNFENMVGKHALGVFAMSLTYSGFTFANNKMFSDLENILKTNGAESDEFLSLARRNMVGDLMIVDKKFRPVLGNVNYYRLTPEVIHGFYTAVINELESRYSEELDAYRKNKQDYDSDVETVYVDNVISEYRTALADGAVQFKQFIMQRSLLEYDVADLLSQLLSEATDNAKTKDLAPLHCSDRTAGNYAVMTMLGIPFFRQVEIMSNPAVIKIYSYDDRYIFAKNNYKSSTGAIEVIERTHNSPNNNYEIRVVTVDDKPYMKVGSARMSMELARTVVKIYWAKEETRIAGKYYSINRGIAHTSYEMYRFRKTLEQFVLSRNPSSDFDTNEFIRNTYLMKHGSDEERPAALEYVNRVIDQYDPYKSIFNVLNALIYNDHFVSQYMSYYVADRQMYNNSLKHKFPEIMQRLLRANYFHSPKSGMFDEKTYNELERYIDGVVTMNYFKDNPVSIFFQVNGELNRLNLSKASDRYLFIKNFDRFVSKLRNDSRFKGNEFINAIRFEDETDPLTGIKYPVLKLTLDTSWMRTDHTKIIADSYSKGLKDLVPQIMSFENGMSINIGEAFLYYNMIMNKTNITKNSYGQLLYHAFPVGDNENNYYSNYFKYIADLDRSYMYKVSDDRKTVTFYSRLSNGQVKALEVSEPAFEKYSYLTETKYMRAGPYLGDDYDVTESKLRKGVRIKSALSPTKRVKMEKVRNGLARKECIYCIPYRAMPLEDDIVTDDLIKMAQRDKDRDLDAAAQADREARPQFDAFGNYIEYDDDYYYSKDASFKSKAATVSTLNTLVNRMMEANPDVEIEMITGVEIKSIFPDRPDLWSDRAFIYRGKIYINTDRSAESDVLHEYAHIFLRHMKNLNSELYNKLIKAVESHPLYSEIVKMYEGLDRSSLQEEAFVTILSEMYYGNLNSEASRLWAEKNKPVISSFWDRLKSFVRRIFGADDNVFLPDNYYDLSIKEIINLIGDSIRIKFKISCKVNI